MPPTISEPSLMKQKNDRQKLNMWANGNTTASPLEVQCIWEFPVFSEWNTQSYFIDYISYFHPKPYINCCSHKVCTNQGFIATRHGCYGNVNHQFKSFAKQFTLVRHLQKSSCEDGKSLGPWFKTCLDLRLLSSLFIRLTILSLLAMVTYVQICSCWLKSKVKVLCLNSP